MKTKFRPSKKGAEKWQPAPARYTIVRLSDNYERYTDRLPRIEVRKNPSFMVWDNVENAQVMPR